jgi:type VI secretion system secreted protein VgrG
VNVRRQVFTSVLTLILVVGAAAASDLVAATQDDLIVDGPARLSLVTPLGEGVLRLVGFRGTESISELFSFELDLVAPGGQAVPFEMILGKELRVAVTLSGGETRYFHGLCSRFSQGDSGDATRYHAEIVPRFWLLTRRQQSRIFQELSVPQILARVLGGVPDLNVDMRLQGTFHARKYTVQYNETDYAFLRRLMVEEGIFFYFRHEAGGHTLVIANTPEGHPEIPEPVPFRTAFLILGRPNSIYAWEKTQEIRSGKVTLWDHNFETPGQNHEGSAVIQESVQAGQVTHSLRVAGNDTLEVYDYPGYYAQRFDGIDPGGGERPEELLKIDPEARRTAEIRMQAEAAQSLAIQGVGTASMLTAGHRFTLARHSDASGPYVLTSVSHAAREVTSSGAAVYHNTFTCIPSALPYRPLKKGPKPVIPGTQTAVVVGPPGEEIFTDKYGRVKVQFNWDRQGQKDADSSCWIRVLQPATGSGSVLIPRVGWEVVVSFEEGDPDRPIVLGRVYNPDSMPEIPPRITTDP